jgi:hypothetical protein
MTMKLNRVSAWSAVGLAVGLAIGGCGGGEGDQKKSPFATDNVTVAPQVEGRAPAPTPIEVPRPDAEPTVASP